MIDDADQASDLIEATESNAVERIRIKANQIPNGEPGDCELCGQWSGRLVDGACAPCRDRFKLN